MAKIIIAIDRVEEYPVYDPHRLESKFQGAAETLEVEEETLVRWEQVLLAYDKVQSELAAVYRQRQESEPVG